MTFESPDEYLDSFSPENTFEEASPEELLGSYLLRQTEAFKTPADFRDFEQVYSKKTIRTDQTAMASLQNQETWNYSGERSAAITNLLLHLVSDLEYFKPNDEDWDVYTDVTHKYDDVMRGSDMIIVFVNSKTGQEFPMAIDTTISEDIDNKKEKTVQDIEHGNLRKLKYYTNPITNEPIGEMEMPAAIISFTPENFDDLARRHPDNRQRAFKEARLEFTIRNKFIKQFRDQIKTVEKIAPEDKKEHLIEQLETMIAILESSK